MAIRTLAHLSDLHIGLPGCDRAAAELCQALTARAVDHVVVTGDITHRGKRSELERFRALFAPLYRAGRMTLVPGNHDRWNDDVALEIMPGEERVDVVIGDGLYLVRADSSGPHNRNLLLSHGSVDARMIEAMCRAFDRAPATCLRALLLHHHLLPQPEESFGERVAAFIGWPHVGELHLASALIEHLRGRCDLILHGHRHVPRAVWLFPEAPRPLAVMNAGSSTQLGRARIFVHKAGVLCGEAEWLCTQAARAAA
jgi:3',5'-cyclic AMP phosphodiesterase CpdA